MNRGPWRMDHSLRSSFIFNRRQSSSVLYSRPSNSGLWAVGRETIKEHYTLVVSMFLK